MLRRAAFQQADDFPFLGLAFGGVFDIIRPEASTYAFTGVPQRVATLVVGEARCDNAPPT